MTNQEAAETLRQMASGVRQIDMAACLTGAASLEREESRKANDDEIAYMMGARRPEPARRICPAVKGQDCEGCPHGIEHDHGDCEALDGCPACREVTP